MVRKKYLVWAAVLLTLILSAAVWGSWRMQRQYIRYQQCLVGQLYRQQPELSGVYLSALFETAVTEENLAAGQEALQKDGYTSKGMEYFWREQDFGKVSLFPWLVQLAAAVVLFCLLCYGAEKIRHFIEVDQKSKKELKKQLNETLYLEKQNERLQSFIENVAHQIRTPVSRVVTALELIEDDGCSQRQQMRISECFSHLETIRQLAVRLIDIGKLEAGKVLFVKERLELGELLSDSAAAAMGDSSRFFVRMEPKGENRAVYCGDYEWLRQAFVNLFRNCAEHDPGTEPVEIVCRHESECYVIQIRDHGCGFEKEDIPNLFCRFYQPAHVKNGHVGIGLNLAQLVIEGHFGTITAANHEEGGACFHIRLPLYGLKEEKV